MRFPISDFRLPILKCAASGGMTFEFIFGRGASILWRSHQVFKSAIGNRQSAILALLLAGLTGCQKQEPMDTLVIYSAGPRELAEWTCNEFEKETGSHTKLFCATTGEVMAKLQAEEFHPNADMILLASSTAAEALKQAGRFAPLPDLSALPIRPEWTDPEHFYTGTSASALGIAVRKDRANDILDWNDVYSGKVSGAIIMPSPSQSGTSAEFVTASHVVIGEPFWKGLETAKKNSLQISGPNSQALSSLILGSHVAVLAAADYLVFKQIEKGEPLAMIFPASGCPIIPRPIAILNNSHNPRLAEKFVRFCFSQRVQERIAKEHLIPADTRIALSSLRKQAANLNAMPLDPAQAVKIQREVLRRFRYEIERTKPGASE